MGDFLNLWYNCGLGTAHSTCLTIHNSFRMSAKNTCLEDHQTNYKYRTSCTVNFKTIYLTTKILHERNIISKSLDNKQHYYLFYLHIWTGYYYYSCEKLQYFNDMQKLIFIFISISDLKITKRCNVNKIIHKISSKWFSF